MSKVQVAFADEPPHLAAIMMIWSQKKIMDDSDVLIRSIPFSH